MDGAESQGEDVELDGKDSLRQGFSLREKRWRQAAERATRGRQCRRRYRRYQTENNSSPMECIPATPGIWMKPDILIFLRQESLPIGTVNSV
jgi:hypothetical protein